MKTHLKNFGIGVLTVSAFYLLHWIIWGETIDASSFDFGILCFLAYIIAKQE